VTGLPVQLRLYQTTDHACPYLPEQTASSVVIDPELEIDTSSLSELTRHGFRRSGQIVYRPQCPLCSACQSLRIPVHDFSPDRSQRRVWARNRDLQVVAREAGFYPEHFELYLRYQQSRHAGSEMCDPDPDKYYAFVVGTRVETIFFEARLGGQLVSVAVIDELDDGVSAVYTFFDPAHAVRSLGTYAILRHIDYARQTHRHWVYLGYWIEECTKMKYKARFRPAEVHRQHGWRRLPAHRPFTP